MATYYRLIHKFILYLIAVCLFVFINSSLSWAIAYSGDYYISPNGLDSNSGITEQQPWKTFEHSINNLNPGDTLILLDGVYKQTLDLDITGTAQAPITIKAKNDGKVVIDGEGIRQPGVIGKSTEHIDSYIVIKGIIFKNAKSGTDEAIFRVFNNHNIIKRCSFYFAESGTNQQGLVFASSQYNLAEDCIAAYVTRHCFISWDDNGLETNNIFRRCFATGNHPDRTEPLAISHFNIYGSSYDIIENSIGFYGTHVYGASVHSQTGANYKCKNNKVLGSIFIGAGRKNPTTDYPGSEFYHGTGIIIDHSGGEAPINNTVKDCIFYDNKMHGILIGESGRTINTVIDHCTIVNNKSHAIRTKDPLTNISNSIFYNNGYGYNNTYKKGTFSYIDNFGNTESNGIPSGDTWTNSFSTDPLITGQGFQIPLNSPCYGTGKNGSNIGATINKRYVNGVLTGDDLWPWPMQDRILTELNINLMAELNTRFGSIIPFDQGGPVITSTPVLTAKENETYSYQVTAEDINNDTLTFTLEQNPQNMTIDSNGLITWQPLSSDIGTHSVTVKVSNGNFSSEQTFIVTVTGEYNGIQPVFTQDLIMAYGGRWQDKNPLVTIEDNGNTLLLSGNTWKGISLEYNVTENTVLELEFKSSSQGEIHGIGLDTDLRLSRDKLFKLYGTQKWGIRDYDNYANASPEWKKYIIELGSFYTGNMKYLVFACDHDISNPNAQSSFKNIKIFEKNILKIAPVITSTPILTANDQAIYSYQVTAEDINNDTLTFTLEQNPQNMAIDSNGLIIWEPLSSDIGSHDIIVSVSDSELFSNQTFTLSVTEYNGIAPIFTQNSIMAYGGRWQDKNPLVTIENNGNTLLLSGNTWKGISLEYNVTENTVLELEFKSSSQGEIHGIGLDTDLRLSGNKLFKLYGTQKWGIRDYDNYANASPEWKKYIIELGKFYTGNMKYLVFACDHDISNPNAQSSFKNIKIFEKNMLKTEPVITSTPILTANDQAIYSYQVIAEDINNDTLTFTLEQNPQNMAIDSNGLIIWEPLSSDIGSHDITVSVSDSELFSNQTFTLSVTEYNGIAPIFTQNSIMAYAGQDKKPFVTIEDNGNTLLLSGNTWKMIPFNYSITSNTVIEFEFKSSFQGEIQGIGFDIDSRSSRDKIFKLYGTQAWGIRDYDNYSNSAPNWKFYRIELGSFYTGDMNYMVFVNDHDISNPTAQSNFKNIRIFEKDLSITCQESDWQYSDGECQLDETLTRTWSKKPTTTCINGITKPDTETIACVPTSINTYHIANDGNDNNNGLSPNTPWKTIAKVNSTIFDNDSTILFKQGQTFRGSISLSKSPTGITIGSYGTGNDKPVIKGSVEITPWQPTSHPDLDSSKVWEADVSGLTLVDDDIEHLFANEEIMTIARYPNVDSPLDKNWLKVDHNPVLNSSGKKQAWSGDIFRDQALIDYSKPDNYWTGAVLRIRTYSWTYKVCEITGFDSSLGELKAGCLSNQLPEWGYFIDTKLQELDYPDEWYYDKIAKKVYFYPKNGENPNNILMEGMTENTGVTIYWHEDNAVIENLKFKHFKNRGIYINSSINLIIRNNDIEHVKTGFYVWNCANLLLANNNLKNTFTNAITLSASNDYDILDSIIENNTIYNNSMYRVYGARYNGTYNGSGIRVFGKGFKVKNNKVENIGWTGIYLKSGGEHIVQNNIVTNSLAVLNDGGAIAIGSSNNIIQGNILMNSIGNTDESNGCGSLNSDPCMHHSTYGMGIGADSNFTNNTVENNIITDNPDMGLRFNAFTSSTIKNNTLYNNDPGIVIQDKKGPSYDNTIENNIIYSLNPDHKGLVLTNLTDHGSFANNVYCAPYGEIMIKRGSARYSVPHWKADNSPYGSGSSFCDNIDFTEFIEYNTNSTDSNMITNSTFDTNVDGWGPSSSSNKEWDASKPEMDGGSIKLIYSGPSALNAIPNTLSVVKDQWYRLRFSVIANNYGDIKLRFNDTEGSYRILQERFFAIDTNRKDYEWVFPVDVTTDAGKFIFATDSDDADVYWMDNVSFEPVNITNREKTATILNYSDALSLSSDSAILINPDKTVQTYNVPMGKYVNLDGNPVNSIDLEPYKSIILIKTQ